MVFTTITKFEQITIIPSSLVVFDIDETLLKFDGIDQKWWRNKFNKYYTLTKNYDLADSMSHSDWIKIVKIAEPELIDDKIHDFIDLLYENDCKIILLTARHEILKETTIEHIDKINLNVNKDNIYFNSNKGEELYKIVSELYPTVQNIIVVDDFEQNLIDIQSKMQSTNYNLHLYKIK